LGNCTNIKQHQRRMPSWCKQWKRWNLFFLCVKCTRQLWCRGKWNAKTLVIGTTKLHVSWTDLQVLWK
jgi:hypothetical protein